MKLVLATRNAGKVAEFRRLLAGASFVIETLDEHPDAPEVEETAATYAENAAAKAIAVAAACGLPSLGDDSGLEVDALGGRPGVRSARYSGGGAAENVRLLLRELDGVPEAKRTARFRCALALAWPDGRVLAAEGTCEGRIATRASGAGGFGYDPIFVDPASGLTLAEVASARKDEISHRARACAALLARLGK